MSNGNKILWAGVGSAVLLLVCCLGIMVGTAVTNRNQTSPTSPTNPPAIIIDVTQPPPTTAPTLAPPATAANPDPASSNFQALSQYGETIKPILEQAGQAAERDGAILETGQENPAALCQGAGIPHETLAADANLMRNLSSQLQAVNPPSETAVAIHKPLIDSATLWAEALENISKSCQAGSQAERDLLRLGASLQLGGAIINFHVASDNFWRLAIAYGLEALSGAAP